MNKWSHKNSKRLQRFPRRADGSHNNEKGKTLKIWYRWYEESSASQCRGIREDSYKTDNVNAKKVRDWNLSFIGITRNEALNHSTRTKFQSSRNNSISHFLFLLSWKTNNLLSWMYIREIRKTFFFGNNKKHWNPANLTVMKNVEGFSSTS